MLPVAEPSDFLVYVHTCPQRDATVGQTLESIRHSDVGERFCVIRHEPGLSKEEVLAWWDGELLRLAREATRVRAKWLLRFEDDIVVNRYIIENLCTWPALCEEDFGVGSMFLWNLLAADVDRLGRSEKTGTLFRNKHENPCSQCHMIRAELIPSLVEQFVSVRREYYQHHKGFAMDGAPTTAAWLLGLKTYLHEPSLVDCHDRGMASAQGNKPLAPLVASSFDPDWRRGAVGV